MKANDIKIAVIGLGYVGLPLALALGDKFNGTIGFDISHKKISDLRNGLDPNSEGHEAAIRKSGVWFTWEEKDLKNANFFIVAVPTPIDRNRNPDLSILISASELVGRIVSRSSIVVFESTVYPGVTEEICAPIIEKISGLKRGDEFKVGYSPERMNPGDVEHSLSNIVKVVSGEDDDTLNLIAFVYQSVVSAGVYKAESIKIAEAAKVIENTQRDLNIALMNELSIIFDKMNISMAQVLNAAKTKWNFMPFTPGLVGGHCIGVDPYYLTTKAEQLGYHPQVILAGRRINDGMGRYVAERFVKLLISHDIQPKNAKVGILGITFKENVSDYRNSRVPDIIKELKDFGVEVFVNDPFVSPEEVRTEYGITLCEFEKLKNLDGLIFAVPHRNYLLNLEEIAGLIKPNGILADIKAVFRKEMVPRGINYWSL